MDKTKVILFLFFIFINALVYIITELNLQQRVDLTTKNHLSKLQIHYDICMKSQKRAADTIYKDTIKNNEIINIVEQAWKTNDPALKNDLRQKLFQILGPEYEFLRKRGILQYQFVFPNNRVF